MIARLTMLLPFDFVLPKDAQFKIFEYEDEGYQVREFPPRVTDSPPSNAAPQWIALDGAEAVIANGLQIDFRKDSFDRSAGPHWDPPAPFVMKCVERLLGRLRILTSAPQIQMHALRTTRSRLQYLQDDETEFEKSAGLVRARGAAGFSYSVVAVTPEVWDQMELLGPDFEPSVWDTLLLDARAAMPNVGTGMTLSAAALEVFIAQVLDQLAATKIVPQELWSWINNRDFFLKEPSTEEKFDRLLEILLGHSLKEEDVMLWQAFQNLRSARNSFVHGGVATIGKNKDRVTEDVALKLIDSASQIIKKIHGWLPEDMRWPQPNVTIKVEMAHNIGKMFGVGPVNVSPESPPDPPELAAEV